MQRIIFVEFWRTSFRFLDSFFWHFFAEIRSPENYKTLCWTCKDYSNKAFLHNNEPNFPLGVLLYVYEKFKSLTTQGTGDWGQKMLECRARWMYKYLLHTFLVWSRFYSDYCKQKAFFKQNSFMRSCVFMEQNVLILRPKSKLRINWIKELPNANIWV